MCSLPWLTRTFSSMRMMKEPMRSCFFDALDYFLANSGCLLPNATALVQILLSGQPPPRRLRIEYELSRYGNTDRDSPRYFGELLQPYEGSPCGSGNSGNSAPDGHTDETQNQLPPSDLVLRDFSTRETSLEHIVLDSLPAGTKDPSGVKDYCDHCREFPVGNRRTVRNICPYWGQYVC
jgi:hypothetical protein